MAMLCRVKMTSRCIRSRTAVETEIVFQKVEHDVAFSQQFVNN